MERIESKPFENDLDMVFTRQTHMSRDLYTVTIQ